MKMKNVCKKISAGILSMALVFSNSSVMVLSETNVMEVETEEEEIVVEEDVLMGEEEISDISEDVAMVASETVEEVENETEDIIEEIILGDSNYEEEISEIEMAELQNVESNGLEITALSFEFEDVYSVVDFREELTWIPVTVTYSDGSTEYMDKWWRSSEWNGTKVLYADGIYLTLRDEKGMIDMPDVDWYESGYYVPTGEFDLVAVVDGNEAVTYTKKIRIEGITEDATAIEMGQTVAYNLSDSEKKWFLFKPEADMETYWEIVENNSVEVKIMKVCDGGMKSFAATTASYSTDGFLKLPIEANTTYAILLSDWNREANGSISLSKQNKITGMQLGEVQDSYQGLGIWGGWTVAGISGLDVKAVVTYEDGTTEVVKCVDGHYGYTMYNDQIVFEFTDKNGTFESYEPTIPLTEVTMTAYLAVEGERKFECSQKFNVNSLTENALELKLGETVSYDVRLLENGMLSDVGEVWYELPAGINGMHNIQITNTEGVVSVDLFKKAKNRLVSCEYDLVPAAGKISYDFEAKKEYVLAVTVGQDNPSMRACGSLLLEAGTKENGIKDEINLELNVRYNVTLAEDEEQWFAFSPQYSGTYWITLTNVEEDLVGPCVYWYDAEYMSYYMGYETCGMYSDKCYLEMELEEGRIYYFRTRGAGGAASFEVRLKSEIEVVSVELSGNEEPIIAEFCSDMWSLQIALLYDVGMHQYNLESGETDDYGNTVKGELLDASGNVITDYSSLRGIYTYRAYCENTDIQVMEEVEFISVYDLLEEETLMCNESVEIFSENETAYIKFVPDTDGRYVFQANNGWIESIAADGQYFYYEEGTSMKMEAGKEYIICLSMEDTSDIITTSKSSQVESVEIVTENPICYILESHEGESWENSRMLFADVKVAFQDNSGTATISYWDRVLMVEETGKEVFVWAGYTMKPYDAQVVLRMYENGKQIDVPQQLNGRTGTFEIVASIYDEDICSKPKQIEVVDNISERAIVLEEDQEVLIRYEGWTGGAFVKFIPQTSGTYCFFSDATEEIIVRIYALENGTIGQYTYMAGDGVLKTELKAGVTYYVKMVEYYDGSDFEANVSIKKAKNISNVELIAGPTQREYIVGDTVKAEGTKIRLHYTDGSYSDCEYGINMLDTNTGCEVNIELYAVDEQGIPDVKSGSYIFESDELTSGMYALCVEVSDYVHHTKWDDDIKGKLLDRIIIPISILREGQAHNHMWNESYVVIKDATCMETGQKAITCKLCDEKKDIVEISALGHTGGTATCIEPAVCTRCKQIYGNATGKHDWESVYTIDKNAICIEKGQKSIHCKLCDEKKDITVIPALGHTGGTATCTAQAICSRCNQTYGSVPVGHKYGAWTILTTATVSAAEKQVRKCTVCGQTENRTVGSALQKTMAVTANSITLKTKQSTTGFKVTGLAKGDTIKSITVDNTKVVKISNVNLSAGTCKLTAQKKKGSATLTITLNSGLVKKVPLKVQTSAVKTTGITGVEKKLTMKKGAKLSLKPTLAPFTSTEKIKYSSSNKKVVKVSSKGALTAVKPGTAKITIKAGKKKFICTVTVEGIKNTGLKNVPLELTLKKKKSKTLKPARVPSNSTDVITYKTSNKKVATVSSKGKITAKGKGTATITVKCGSAAATCKVTVK